VLDCLCDVLADRTRSLDPEVVVDLPVLGLSIAPEIARRLRLTNFVALSYSQKIWYSDQLSAKGTSITNPGQSKRLYLDPNLTSRLTRRRAVLADDVVTRGTTLAAARQLLAPVAEIVAAPTVIRPMPGRKS
jgi:adenine/guanine phosphoribosyltransferase-like PRPP-binding protein